MESTFSKAEAEAQGIHRRWEETAAAPSRKSAIMTHMPPTPREGLAGREMARLQADHVRDPSLRGDPGLGAEKRNSDCSQERGWQSRALWKRCQLAQDLMWTQRLKGPLPAEQKRKAESSRVG